MSVLHYDLCIIGGGINGAGIARDAAGRGLSVLLVEAQDLGGGTSSASTKLIHGGLRYLGNFEFSMVRKALQERELVYKNARHLVWPVQCVLPFDDEKRPRWMVRAGVWLYDHLGGKTTLPHSTTIELCKRKEVYTTPLRQPEDVGECIDGLVYSDCWADDTRLVIANALDAAANGAVVLTYTACDSLKNHEGKWHVGLRDTRSDDQLGITASMVVNATGPWVGQFLNQVGIGIQDPDLPHVRLVKGSHLILPKQYEGDHAYVLQQPDGRVVFVASYEGAYTLVGTTEEDYDGDPRDVRISKDETAYLCAAYNRSFANTIKASDALFTYSGVRPLIDDGHENASKVTRDYKIYQHTRQDIPLFSVFGGKLTTYRAVSEDVVNELMRVSGRVGQPWTAEKQLPGGDFGEFNFDLFLKGKQAQYSWLPPDLVHRYARAYGAQMDVFLAGREGLEDMGVHYGDQVYEAELHYLMGQEWAQTVEDVIWRRSKLGLHISDETIDNIDRAMGAGYDISAGN